MACSSVSMAVESYEEPVVGTSSGSEPNRNACQRRRHSSYHPRRRLSSLIDNDNIHLKVERFLVELERRLDFLENYGNLKLDTGIKSAYSTLQAVRDACSHVSGEVLDAGKRRAKVLVETLEDRYNDALATKETLEAKALTAIHLMEATLADFESRAYAMRDAGFGTVAGELMDSGRRRLDEGYEMAKGVVDGGIERAWRAKESLTEKVEHAITRAREHGLIKYEDLPEPWRVNPHILRGYRFTETKIDCVRSVLRISNESVNIWSHAIGLMIVLAIAFYFYPMHVNFSLSTKSDVFIAAVFFFAACKCLVCSTMWHTMNSIAEQKLMERFACVDYTGISLLIAASIMTSEYTAFYCEPMSRWGYMLTTATLGVGGVILPWHPTFNRADMSWARVAFYVSLGATGFLPFFQLTVTRGWAWSIYFYAPVVKSILVYLFGALIYAHKIPERWWPGFFDYFGGSHNLWHFAVLGGIFFHYLAMQDFFAGAFRRAEAECMLR
ncbi:HlyIII-domain-containing protein [Xylona heveae TC161]|uniref:HlyIII-domain-containing protein n=1 Tax=Xylona heveae (strain CBS 132557 / TC161) TaxID=1328760 RepID=A0A165IF14_XYLHT|nr:HlyIII-domain-containing protein [Xylona heveae TC161]KZF24803.1 HlyIII-domain-containing protein [Xylona heveae TC161]